MPLADVYIEQSSAYFAALSADEAWQSELDFRNIDRYSADARGEDGSQLRGCYLRKLAADERLRQATDAMRHKCVFCGQSGILEPLPCSGGASPEIVACVWCTTQVHRPNCESGCRV